MVSVLFAWWRAHRADMVRNAERGRDSSKGELVAQQQARKTFIVGIWFRPIIWLGTLRRRDWDYVACFALLGLGMGDHRRQFCFGQVF